jgi:hypothetical protein
MMGGAGWRPLAGSASPCVPGGLSEADPSVLVLSLENTFYVENTFYQHILYKRHTLSRVPPGLGEENPPVLVHSLENTFYIENTFYLENLEASAKQTPLLLFVCQGPLAEPRQLAVCQKRPNIGSKETYVKRDQI